MAFKNIFGRKSSEDIFDDDDDFEYGDDDSPAPSLNPKDEKTISEMKLRARAFTSYNRQKIHSIEGTLTEFDREIFWLLPPLVHLNVAGLPGYIEEEERHPGIIWNFKPDDSMLSLLQRFCPKSTISPRDLMHAKSKNIIYSLSAMGSLATIAQTKKSDFDIWVCIEKEEFTEAQLDGLNQ